MELTLRHKINGAIVVTFVLVVIVFSAVQIPFQQHRMQDEINDIKVLLQTLVERDTEQLANEIFDSRLKAIELRISQMKAVEGIMAIFVFDKTGKKLVSTGDDSSEKNLRPKEINLLEEQSRLNETEWRGQAVLAYTKQIAFLSEKLGFIRIYYSLNEVNEYRRKSFLMDAGMLAAIFLVMLVVLNLILSRAILHPVTHLRDATRFIAYGNYDNPIRMERSDELGSLADSFETMRRAIREKIHDLEQLTKIIESTSDLVSWSTVDGRISYLNRAGKVMFGIPETDQAGGMPIANAHPTWAFRKISESGIPAAIEKGTWAGETAVVNFEGNEVPVSQVIISHKDENGNPEFLSTIIRDISEQKKSENELRYLRNYLANIIDSMPSILIGVDREQRVTQWNAEASRKTGISPEAALGKNLMAIFPRMAAEKKLLERALSERRMMLDSKHVYQEQGQNRFEDVTVFPLSGEGLEGAVIRIDDVTEKVNMEELMIQSEKMLSVGGLAAGMAHEINNPLAGMIQAASVIGSRLTDDALKANLKAAESLAISMSDIKAYTESRGIPAMLENLHESGQRAAKIVTNMLSFARKSDEGFTKQNLVELLEQTTEMAGSDYDLKKKFDFRRIEVVREYEPDLPLVACEAGKIQQVLLNVLRNGAEAMQDTGEDSESDAGDRKGLRFIFRAACHAGSGMVQLEIEDNGPGMTEENRKRVFEPFFTTKPTGSGTGLGLSVSYFIITENHGGKMSVESLPGRGTKFIIQLPVDQKPA